MIDPLASGPARGAAGRVQRHQAILSRWPVLNEDWARRIDSRLQESAGPAGPAGPARPAAPAPGAGITPLVAINRALGLPDDHGADAIRG